MSAAAVLPEAIDQRAAFLRRVNDAVETVARSYSSGTIDAVRRKAPDLSKAIQAADEGMGRALAAGNVAAADKQRRLWLSCWQRALRCRP